MTSVICVTHTGGSVDYVTGSTLANAAQEATEGRVGEVTANDVTPIGGTHYHTVDRHNDPEKLALTMQRYRIRRRISQLRFLDSALLQPVCEVGRRRIVTLRDELLGGPVGEQRLDFRTVLVQLAFAGAFRPSDRQAGSPSRAKGFLRPRGDQPPLDLGGH